VETTADYQQQRFQREKQEASPNNKSPRIERGFVTDGLWAWSRHPNFACEQCLLGLSSGSPFSGCFADLKWSFSLPQCVGSFCTCTPYERQSRQRSFERSGERRLAQTGARLSVQLGRRGLTLSTTRSSARCPCRCFSKRRRASPRKLARPSTLFTSLVMLFLSLFSFPFSLLTDLSNRWCWVFRQIKNALRCFGGQEPWSRAFFYWPQARRIA
jgi:hypothetical protein